MCQKVNKLGVSECSCSCSCSRPGNHILLPLVSLITDNRLILKGYWITRRFLGFGFVNVGGCPNYIIIYNIYYIKSRTDLQFSSGREKFGSWNRGINFFPCMCTYSNFVIESSIWMFLMNIYSLLLRKMKFDIRKEHNYLHFQIPENIIETTQQLQGIAGNFSSHNFPSAYPPQSLMEWKISVPKGFNIRFTFHSFSLLKNMYPLHCLKFHKLHSRCSPVLFTYCDAKITSPLYVPGN